MIIRSVLTALVLGLATLAIADPPGILDGENIPADFTAANLQATQRNSTQFGDYFVVPGLLVQGNEMDQLFVAKSATNDALHLGITGNLATNGNIFLIGINVPGRIGQTENRTEGTGVCESSDNGGPPWTVQASSREVVIDDGGTPMDNADDTYSFGATGMIFPTETDYLFAVDVFAGTIHVQQYNLHEVDGVGIGTWDPTPGNVADAPTPLYAERASVADGPINDGDDILNSTVGITEGGFDNSNLLGITDTDASGAATATTGLEIAIPFSAIPVAVGPPDTLLNGTETLEVYVIMVDGVENSCVGDAFGHVVNQVLPSLAAGPPCDTTPGLIGFRPDLTMSMGVVTVDMSTLATFGGVADGVIDPLDYDASVGALQTCPTPYGDQFFDNSAFDRGGGSELDALYLTSDALNLYVGITGNLQENGDRLQIWIDNGIGAAGDHILSWDGMGNPGDGMEDDAMPPLPDQVTDALFDYALSINIQGPAPDPDRQVFADFWDIIAQTSTFKGFSIRESGNGTLDTSTGGSNQWGMQVALNNLNSAGVPGCQPFEAVCSDHAGNPNGSWFDDAATVEALAAGVTTGFEIAIPLADIGVNPCDPSPATIQVWAHVTGSSGWRSNQSLPSMRPEAGNPDSTEQVQNAENLVTDWFQSFPALPEDFYRAVTATHITTPLAVVVNDCNANGIEDVCDILADPSLDLDFSGVPDVCEIVTCTTTADCADQDTNGTTDDVCTWWACEAGVCVSTPLIAPSDMGGAGGTCPPDGNCNLADALTALKCFSGLTPCEKINIDAGGAAGSCAPDGNCNLADALAALTCFAGTNTCSCGPSPTETNTPTKAGSATLRAVADARSIKAGSEVQVRMFVDQPLKALLGYQLTAVTSGGRNGTLELVDIEVEGRRDAVYARATNPYEAFNVENGQMLAGNFDGPTSTGANGYLATFTYRASDDAVGTFVVDVVRNDLTQTMMVGAETSDDIVVTGTRPAVIVVTSNSVRSVR